MPTSRPSGISLSACLALGLALMAIDVSAQTWNLVTPAGTAPPLRRLHGMIVDEEGSRLVVTGGEYDVRGTWALSLSESPAWVDLGVLSPSVPGGSVNAIFDSQGRRMILLLPNMSVWALDLANPVVWTELVAAGAGPADRGYPAVAYDSNRNRLVVFGGGPDGGLRQDVWVLPLSGPATWQQLFPAGPGPVARWAAVAVFDPIGDKLVVATGQTDSGLKDDIWTLSLADPTAWVELTPAGPRPPARYLAAAAYDPGTQQLILHGGYQSAGLADLWGIDLSFPTAWSSITPAGPLPSTRWSHRLSYHGASATLYTYGGWDGVNFRGDVWALPRPNPTAPPEITGFSPAGGRPGDVVVINGLHLQPATAATIGGQPAEIVSGSYTIVRAIVPVGAVTGPVSVTTPNGTAESGEAFAVGELPEITGATPDSGRIGDLIEIRGRNLTLASDVRFGVAGSAAFTVLSDTVLTASVDPLASSGPIRVTTLIGSTQSSFDFQLIDDARPRLLSVRDVALDQGGKVMLRWRASDFDKSYRRAITAYRVWRRAPLDGASSAAPDPTHLRSSRTLGLALADPSEFWEPLADLPAASLAGYAYAAATLQDSTELGNPYSAYFVQAVTADPFVFYNSSPDSGYSVDNLAPPTPAPFAVVYAATGNTLHWRGRAIADLRGYRIHRGSDATFAPGPANLVAATSDTSFVDIAGQHFYKLAAVDIHGNLSRYVAVSPDRPVATLVSFLRSFRDHGLARVTWYSGGNPGLAATVYRRNESTDWERAGSIWADGQGYLTFEDREVVDGVRYGYRLGIAEPDEGEVAMGETWVEPLAVAFAFAGRLQNPSSGGRFSCAFMLPAGSDVNLRLYDISGRQVERLELAGGTGGERTVEFGASRRLRAGVYLLRAAHAGAVMTRRVIVLD